MDCKFKDNYERCSVGCVSINIDISETCPFAFVSESFKSCPCHPEGLTFILANRVSKLIKEAMNNITSDNFPQMSDDEEDDEEIKRLEKEGHTHRCASRIVLIDGQCECENVEIIEVVKYNE